MKNVMFKETPIPTPSRGSFDLSHEKKLSCQIGELIPFTWWECVPGDKFSIRSEMLVKFSSLLRPLLHRVDAYIHYFKVPYRLLMNESGGTYAGWKDFITGDPESYFTNEVLPYVTISNATKAQFVEGSLADYLGLPVIDSGTTVTQDVDINVLPFFAMHLIFDDYYRDENLMAKQTGHTVASSAPIDLHGGDHTGNVGLVCPIIMRQRSYEKDYFRGALPTAYFGASADVELDIGVVGTGLADIDLRTDAGANPAAGALSVTATGEMQDITPDNLRFQADKTQGLDAVLEIMELRRAMAITKFLEAENRGGHRYNEMLLGVWGVSPKNAELDYPEYLGGGKQAVQVSSILNQSQTLDPTAGVNDGVGGAVVTVDPQAFEAGKALASGSTNRIETYCSEHCLIMGILSVLPRTAYGGAQIEKFWRKIEDREDFFVPQLQGIGDQAILQSEVGYDATGTDMDDVFGYAPPWSEYKFKNSTVHGSFLSTLSDWHMATIGDTSGAGPDLNTAFVNCNAANDEITRIFADQTAADKLYIEIYNDVRAIRPMQVFDVPK